MAIEEEGRQGHDGEKVGEDGHRREGDGSSTSTREWHQDRDGRVDPAFQIRMNPRID